MFSERFEKICDGYSLSIDEARSALEEMLSGSWSDRQTAAFLTALHLKKETPEELAGFAVGMWNRAIRVELNGLEMIDTCGTGGDRRGSFNISTISAFVLAGAGVPVVKHGNRAASSQCGSADLLSALGIRYRLRPDEIAIALEKCSFAFLFAPDFHPAAKQVAVVRRELGVPTIFNLLGPLINPANPSCQLIGVYSESAAPLMAAALKRVHPRKRFAVLYGSGWDEATLHCPFQLHDGNEVWLHRAEEYGFARGKEEEIRGGSAEVNAEICLSILQGERSARRDTVLLNSLLAYKIFRPEKSIAEIRVLLEESIDSGRALNVVKKLQAAFPGGNE